MNERETVVDRVRKLRVKAENQAATPEERDTFLKKVGEMMHKHQIEEAELVGTTESKGYVNVPVFGIATRGFHAMCECVARLTNVRLVHTQDDPDNLRPTGMLVAFGTELNLESFNEVLTHLGEEINNTLQGFEREGGKLVRKGGEKSAFLDGIFLAVCDKITDILAEMKSDGRELVCVELDNFMNEEFGEAKTDLKKQEEPTPMEIISMLVGRSVGKGIKVRKDVK